MTKIQKLIISISVLLLAGILGCAAFQDGLVPCYIDPGALEYVDVNDIRVFTPWTSLWDAERLAELIDYKHKLNQVIIARMLEDDSIAYAYIKDIHAQHIASGRELKTNLFSPEGAFGLLLPALGGLGIGWLGLSKPTDKKQIETLKNGGK